MAVITLKIVVGDITAVMNTFSHLKVYRSITGIDGTYVELTTLSDRPVLEAGKTLYEHTDLSGDPDYYYKSSYFNPTGPVESTQSDAQQGEGDPALDVVSVAELKGNYLFGLDLTDDSGNEYPDSMHVWFIRSAVDWLEKRLDLPIRPKSITEEKHDFYRDDYPKYVWMSLKHYPVIAVDSVKLVLPGEQVVHDFDDEWIHIQQESGQLQLVPGVGSAGSVFLGAGGQFLRIIHRHNKFIPDAFRVTYTAGFPTGEVPAVIKDLAGKVASFGPLNIAGDLLGGAGIASQAISIDGLSQSFNTTSSSTSAGYGARLIQYAKEINVVIPTLQRYYKGIRMVIV